MDGNAFRCFKQIKTENDMTDQNSDKNRKLFKTSLKDMNRKPFKRVAESVFIHSLKGSLTVEGSLALPIFIFFMITLLSAFIMIRTQSENTAKLHERALIELESGVGSARDYIDVDTEYELSPVIRVFPISFSIKDHLLVHAFTGYTGERGNTINFEEDEYVYITENGTKYHLDADCTYINIRPRAVNASEIGNLRNSSGGKYTPCRLCHPSKSGVLYITTYGDTYHSESDCSALKRTVRMITLREALNNGYTPCSKCA